MTFRRRILIAMLPLFVLLVALGTTGIFLIYHLGDQVGKILTENYDSVIFMRDLNEALERIDSSFQFVLAGRGEEEQSHKQYQENWEKYQECLGREQRNITVHGERELVDKLTDLTKSYLALGDAFYNGPAADRDALYFGNGKNEDRSKGKKKGLNATFQEIKNVSGKILRLNEQNMKDVDLETKRLARSLLIWYGLGLACGIVLAVFLVGNTIRMIAYPVRAATESAMAIGAGNLDQVVPITSDDELGQLALAFNTMARQLREFRQSHKAQLIRAQRTSQATIDSFPEPVLVVDPLGRVEMVNPAARRLFGLPQRDNSHATPVIWEPPEALRQPLAEALQEQRQYVPEGFDKVIVLQQGEHANSYLPRVLPIRDASATLGAAVLLEDVTRFRLLDEVKSNMVATVSHELKTPLASIRLVLHLLLEENVGPLLPKQLEFLIDARDNAERLLAMVNNLLDLARLEQGGSHLRVFPEPPATLLRCAFDAFQPRARRPGSGTHAGRPRHQPTGARRQGPIPTRLAEPHGERPGPHTHRRPHYLGGRIRARPRHFLGDGYGFRHPRRISFLDLSTALPRSRRHNPGRKRTGAGDRPRNRYGPRWRRRVREHAGGEDYVSHVAARERSLKPCPPTT